MKTSNNQVTVDEAKAALKSLENIEKGTFLFSRPPLWINAIISLLVGVATMATAMSSNNSLWTLVAILAALAVILSFVILSLRLRTLGMALKSAPPTWAGKIFSVAAAVVIGLVMVGAMKFYDGGAVWAPYAAAAMNGIACSFLLYSYLPNEWVAKGDS